MFTFNLDLLGQIYLVSFFVGGVFIIVNVLIGQLGQHSGGPGHSIHHPGLDHAMADHTSGGHYADAHANSAGHGLGHHIGDNHSMAHSDGFNSTDSLLNSFMSGSIFATLRRRLLILVQGEDLPARLGLMIIATLSPMRIAIWLTFFGLTGLFVSRALPFLHFLSIIPAFFAGMLMAQLFSGLICWAIDRFQSPSLHGNDDLIGTLATVNTPMASDKTGEIVYVIDSTRCNLPARPVGADAGAEIKRGAKVMIVEIKNNVALVEPVTDPMLLENMQEN